jgi:DNA-binding HxlR family transcriptional regulator
MLDRMAKVPDSRCSIARTLGVLGERWTFLILREAFLGATRFADFRQRLGIAPDVLSDRLSTLTEYGVLQKEPYQEPGERSRFAYRLTAAGQELQVILGALQQWGDDHLPHPDGPSMLRRRGGPGGPPLHVGYIDDEGREVTLPDVRMIPAGSAAGPAADL